MKHPNGDPMGLAAQGYGGYYGEPTQHQYTMQQQQQQYTYEEYAHYPHPEEYMNERNRAYFHHNGEQYAMPTKQQQRHRLDSDCKYYRSNSILESFLYRNGKFSHFWKFPAAFHLSYFAC